jgi:hypothetical protein
MKHIAAIKTNIFKVYSKGIKKKIKTQKSS